MQELQELGRKLRKLEAQEFAKLNSDPTFVDNEFLPHVHPDPNVSVNDNWFLHQPKRRRPRRGISATWRGGGCAG